MPRQIDHFERRQHVASTAAALIARGGLDALTFRAVAKAAGCSTTVVTHYFADKRDLLHTTFLDVSSRQGARFDHAKQQGRDIVGCLEALLPLDPPRRDEWRLVTCFWGAAISDPELGAVQAERVRNAHRRVREMIPGEFPGLADADADVLARRFIATLHGIGAECAHDPDWWPAKRQLAVLRGIADTVSSVGRRAP